MGDSRKPSSRRRRKKKSGGSRFAVILIVVILLLTAAAVAVFLIVNHDRIAAMSASRSAASVEFSDGGSSNNSAESGISDSNSDSRQSLFYDDNGSLITDENAQDESSGSEEIEYEADGITRLYEIDEATAFYSMDYDGNVDFDNIIGLLGGLYTGRVLPDNPGYIEIDYLNGVAFVSADRAHVDSEAKIMPAASFSQLWSGSEGRAACGPACLYTMQRVNGWKSRIDYVNGYTPLVDYAQANGYADQGSLYDFKGGMTCYSLIDLAKDVYGVELVNVYSNKTAPSAVVRSLIDEGKQAIVLLSFRSGEVTYSDLHSHFVLVTGYTMIDGKTNFIFADNYFLENIEIGQPLEIIDENLFNRSVETEFGEPNAIICVSDADLEPDKDSSADNGNDAEQQ